MRSSHAAMPCSALFSWELRNVLPRWSRELHRWIEQGSEGRLRRVDMYPVNELLACLPLCFSALGVSGGAACLSRIICRPERRKPESLPVRLLRVEETYTGIARCPWPIP